MRVLMTAADVVYVHGTSSADGEGLEAWDEERRWACASRLPGSSMTEASHAPARAARANTETSWLVEYGTNPVLP